MRAKGNRHLWVSEHWSGIMAKEKPAVTTEKPAVSYGVLRAFVLEGRIYAPGEQVPNSLADVRILRDRGLVGEVEA